jgi:hypothetical protein
LLLLSDTLSFCERLGIEKKLLLFSQAIFLCCANALVCSCSSFCCCFFVVCVYLHAKLNARLATLRHDVTARAAARAETDQARETNPDLTDFAKQSARRKVKGATLLLRHASSGGGAGGVVVTDPNAEVGRGEGREREGRGGVRVRGGAP